MTAAETRDRWIEAHRKALSLSGMAVERDGDTGVTLYAKSAAAYLALAAHHVRAHDSTINELGFVACASFADLGGARAVAESLYRLWPAVTAYSVELSNRLAAPALTTAVRRATLRELADSQVVGALDQHCRRALPQLVDSRPWSVQ